METIRNYINGRWESPVAGEYIDNIEPATGDIYSRLPDSDERDVRLAVEAARKAFPSWSDTSLEERHDLLMKISGQITARLDELAEAESRDNGKPISLARKVDIPRAASNFRFFATALMHFHSESHEMPATAVNYTLRQPLGVVGCISPWNLPLYLFTWKIAPALATGNTVVAKPSEITPMTACLLSEICLNVGLPRGVLNIVHGLGTRAGDAIVRHPEVKAISFTGGTKTGAGIARIAGPEFKKLSLELGGKNPNIIFADCPYDEALRTTALSSFSNQGQICLCGSRIFIERSIYDKFRSDFLARIEKLVPGDPSDPETRIGALVSEGHMKKVLSYIELAKEEGGTVICGGRRIRPEGRCRNGYFVEPTVIEGLDPFCRTNQEEIFGPVVSLIPFDGEEEAIEWANCTPYGLSSTVWTSDLRRAHRVARQIQAGIIWINCWLLRDLRTPFGGMKQSGVGREGGFEVMRFFTEAKNVCIKY